MTGGGTLPFIVLAPGVLVSDLKSDTFGQPRLVSDFKSDTYGQRGASAASVGLKSDAWDAEG